MLGIGEYLWRLLPANPILLRVITLGGRRIRDLVVRCVYLGLLVAIVLAVLFTSDSSAGQGLTQLTMTSSRIFEQLSYFQLALVAMLAPIFTAGAITQEKDSQTYDILLATPLTNGQVVLGSLLSRLFFVFALLISGIPIFSITQIFGGVAFGDVLLSVAIAGVTALFTGALAIAIATFKVGTRRTIFSFYLFNVVYLVGFFLLDAVPALKIPLVDATGAPTSEPSKLSWLTGLHPFLSLRVVLDPTNYPPPTLAQLPMGLRGWPTSWLATNPVSFYIWIQLALSLLLVMPSIVLLRRLAQSSSTIQSKLMKWIPFRRAEQVRPARAVWNNPIAWREAKTKASAARSTLIRWGFMGAGLIGAIILVIGYSREGEAPATWIDHGSYNSAAGTLTVLGAGAKTYGINKEITTVKINGQSATLADLNGRYALDNETGLLAKKTSGANEYLLNVPLRKIPRQIPPATARQFLLGLVIVEICAILLIITNAAASTVTREKEDGTLDLLLSTPITSHSYIWGKVRGLVSYVLPLLAIPIASCALFVLADMWATARGSTEEWIVLPESLLVMPGMLVVVAAFASIVGMQMSLRLRTTVWAVMSSVGIVLGAAGAAGWCGYALLANSVNSVTTAISSFSPFTMLILAISSDTFSQHASSNFGSRGVSVLTGGDNPIDAGIRATAAIFGVVATACYAGIVYAMYTSMVKNFDMTIRKQSR